MDTVTIPTINPRNNSHVNTGFFTLLHLTDNTFIENFVLLVERPQYPQEDGYVTILPEQRIWVTQLMASLAVGTKYYIRAYAQNSTGYSYGSEVSFTTVAKGNGGFMDLL